MESKLLKPAWKIGDPPMPQFCSILEDKDAKMTGKERYPVIGGLFTADIAEVIMPKLKGLNPFWDCLAKADIVRNFYAFGHIMLGSCLVYNSDMSAYYGYEYFPPYEFHAWWQNNIGENPMIIDIALPGVILKGNKVIDSQGPILYGREPSILAGYPPFWIKYKAEAEYVDIKSDQDFPCNEKRT